MVKKVNAPNSNITENLNPRHSNLPRAFQKLNPTQIAVVLAFAGNNWDELSDISGYAVPYIKKLMGKPHIQDALLVRHKVDNLKVKKSIADRKQRQEFWTSLMIDEDSDPYVRLRASELLGKSEGDFVNRTSHEFPQLGNMPPAVRQALDAQYKRRIEDKPDRDIKELEEGSDGVYTVPE